MKTIILLFAFLLLTGKSYCQAWSDSMSKESSTKEYFVQKSKNQKSGAWALLIGGVVIFAGTALYDSHNLDFNDPHKNRGMVPIYLSIACVADSVPLFIAAGRNRLKAIKATAYFRIEKNPILQQTGINFHSYPAISIKLNW